MLCPREKKPLFKEFQANETPTLEGIFLVDLGNRSLQVLCQDCPVCGDPERTSPPACHLCSHRDEYPPQFISPRSLHYYTFNSVKYQVLCQMLRGFFSKIKRIPNLIRLHFRLYICIYLLPRLGAIQCSGTLFGAIL